MKNDYLNTDAQKLKDILREIDGIKSKDIIVHQNYGVGSLYGLVSMKFLNVRHDYFKIQYLGNDILYVPIEDSYLIKKYGYENAELDKLGSNNWERRKNLHKKKIENMAAEIVELSASRVLSEVPDVYYDADAYNKFLQEFQYSLTADQENTVEVIKKELLHSKKLINRLICGDVGFGKTEVIIHACFLFLRGLSKEIRQVIFLCPTTVLARQHYKSINNRLEGWGIKTVELSRMITRKEKEENIKRINSGDVDIIVGTHTLLSANITMKENCLIVIDEEQMFGVAQKEKIKSLQTKSHVISISATPIPRSLQMAITGIKDLSLIATPPLGREDIQTEVIDYDIKQIAEVLKFEKERSGKSFFVCPHIKDLQDIQSDLQDALPEYKVVMAHGRLRADELDRIMVDFYNGKFDILLSTTIVSSGLDVPGVNTIIVYNAHLFGLGQLHQLRGRVGRGKVKARAYFIMPGNAKVTENALSRMDIIKNTSKVGCGFNIASADMDIRGFGNILGKEQAGKIKDIGIEMYQEMLEEAISGSKIAGFDVEVKIPIEIYIPESYIKSIDLRIAFCQRISNANNQEYLAETISVLEQRFGTVPQPVMNMAEIVKVRNKCRQLGIISISISSSYIIKLKYKNKEDFFKAIIIFDSNKIRYKIDSSNNFVITNNIFNISYIDAVHNMLEVASIKLDKSNMGGVNYEQNVATI